MTATLMLIFQTFVPQYRLINQFVFRWTILDITHCLSLAVLNKTCAPIDILNTLSDNLPTFIILRVCPVVFRISKLPYCLFSIT